MLHWRTGLYNRVVGKRLPSHCYPFATEGHELWATQEIGDVEENERRVAEIAVNAELDALRNAPLSELQVAVRDAVLLMLLGRGKTAQDYKKVLEELLRSNPELAARLIEPQ